MNRYALMIMLIVGSLGGLVLASNYGVFEEEGVPEGTVTDPTYGTVPYYKSHTPPDTFECWASIETDCLTPLLGTSTEGSADDLKYVEGKPSDVAQPGIYIIKPNPSDVSKVEFHYKPHFNIQNQEGEFVYEDKKMDYFDVMLYCQIRVWGTDIQNAWLEYNSPKEDFPIKIAEIDPSTDPTYFNGQAYVVDINGMKLEQVKFFQISAEIGPSSAIHIDRLRVLMTHGGSELGDDWWHVATDGPRNYGKSGNHPSSSSSDNTDDFEFHLDNIGWNFNDELAGRSGAHWTLTNRKDVTLDWYTRYKLKARCGVDRYEFICEWGNCPGYVDTGQNDWSKTHFTARIDDRGFDTSSSDGWNTFHVAKVGTPGSTLIWDKFDSDIRNNGDPIHYSGTYTTDLGTDLKKDFDLKMPVHVDSSFWKRVIDLDWDVHLYASDFEFQGHGFRNFDYPIIKEIKMTPNSRPQASNFRLLVDAESNYDGASVRRGLSDGDVQVIIFSDSDPNWNAEQSDGNDLDYSVWTSMWDKSNDGYDGWTTNEYQISEFDSGFYTAWVKVRDSKGHYSYDFFQFEVLIGAATIRLVSPNQEVNSISDLYSVPLVVEVAAQEGYKANGVNYTIYGDNDGDGVNDDPLTGLTPMVEDYFSYEDYWNATFDPYDFGNGVYDLIYYVRDSKSEVERTIILDLWNDPPNIDFNDHYNYMPIRQLYDYLINISVTDMEGDPFTNVSMCFYNLTEDEQLDQQVTPWYNLTNQETVGGDPTDYWQYEIDPVNFTNEEMYYLQVRVNGSYGFNYEGIYVLFERLNPLIQYLPEGTEEYSINSGDEQYDPLSDYYTGEDLFQCEFKVIQGNYSISNFTWYVASDSALTDVYADGFIEHELGTSTYQIEFDPRLLPNGKFFLGVESTNLTDHTFRPQKIYVDIDYYLYNDIADGIENYMIDSKVIYDPDDVVTNDYVIGKTNITYDEENPRGYNYVFDLSDSSVLDYVYGIYPEYKIFRKGLTYYETPETDISTAEKLYFQFGERPPLEYDTLQFHMKTPEIRLRDDFEKPETGTTLDGREYMKIEVILESEHYFSNVHCVYKPSIPISSAENYEYTLYILDGENWEKVDVEVKFSSDSFNQMWQFTIDEIGVSGYEQFTFQIEGIKKEGIDFDWGPILFSFITAGVMAGLTFYIIPTKTDLIKDNRTLRKKKWIYYLIATVITVGAGAGMFFGANALGASLVYYAI